MSPSSFVRPLRFVLGLPIIASLLLLACAPTPPAAAPKASEPAKVAAPAAPAPATAPAARPTEAPKPAGPAVAPAAKPSGRLIIAQGLDPRTLSPLDSTTQQEHNVSTQVIEKLLMYDPSGKIQPYLATEWKVVDPTTLELKLRSNVKFTNGEPLDANAAKYSLETMMKARAYSRYVEDFERVDVVDPLTIRVISKRPSVTVLSTIARGSWMVPPKYHAEVKDAGYGKKPIGTGPFKFTDWVKDSQVVLEANTEYWGGAPPVERVIFKPIPEPSSRAAALEAGDIDLTIDVSLGDIDKLERNANLMIQQVDSMRLMKLTLSNITEGPVKDKRVRQALNYAVDIDTIIKVMLKGRAVKLEGQLATPAYFGFTPSIKAYPFDPNKAKALLTEAGYPTGIDIDFQYTSGRYAQDKEIGEAISQQMAKAGIRARQQVLESGEFLNRQNAMKLGPVFLAGSLTIPELYFQLSQNLTGANYSYYSNARHDELLRQATATLDDTKRAALYAEVNQIAYDDPPHVYLYAPKDAYGINKKVVGFEARPDQWLDLRKVAVK